MQIKSIIWLAAFLAIAGCATHPSVKDGVPLYTKLDQFQNALAGRVNEKIHPNASVPDFQVVVTDTNDPIGTVYRDKTTIPILRANACKPSQDPPMVDALGYFPGTYAISKNLAMELGLDEAVFHGFVKLGANVKDADTLGFSIKNAKRQVLDDQSLKALTGQADCRGALKEMNFDGQTVRIVRGYVTGIRDFSAKRNLGVSANAEITKIGKFKFEPVTNEETIVAKDEQSVQFLQIISEVTIKKEGDAIVPGSLTKVSAPSAGILGSNIYITKGMIFVQMDEEDKSEVGHKLISELKQLSWNVASKVQRVEHARMPKASQIRYFHDEDKAKAEELQETLKLTRSEIKVVRLGFPAPPGQLEIWLTKT